jgi:hypothetical protein
MPNNPEMSKFLYTIVKQLDLKSVGAPSFPAYSYHSFVDTWYSSNHFLLPLSHVCPTRLKHENRLTGIKCPASWA